MALLNSYLLVSDNVRKKYYIINRATGQTMSPIYRTKQEAAKHIKKLQLYSQVIRDVSPKNRPKAV